MNDGNVVGGLEPADPGLSNPSVKNHEEKSKSAVLHRSLHHDPLRVLSAKGNYLHLSNGQKILDATGGAAVACLGHGDERYVLVVDVKRSTLTGIVCKQLS